LVENEHRFGAMARAIMRLLLAENAVQDVCLLKLTTAKA